MTEAEQQQVPLVSAEGTTQSAFPAGWVLAVFEVIHAFAPAFAKNQKLPQIGRTGTGGRINQGASVTVKTYEGLESALVRLVTCLFPKTASVNHFAEKYVKEYFGLWTQAFEIAPMWVKMMGCETAPSGVIAHALIRDLVLRLCYLETCERKLNKGDFTEWELSLLKTDSIPQIYQTILNARTKPRGITLEALARRMKLSERSLRRYKKGKSAPSMIHLCSLKPQDENERLLGCIGVIDGLLRKLRLRDSSLQTEILKIAESILPSHRRSLDSFAGQVLHQRTDGTIQSETHDFESYITYGDNMLLHPGFEEVWPKIPDALWRAHLYNLQFARVADLAQAYFQFSDEENDRALERFFDAAERESGGCPYEWMNRLKNRNNILPFPDTGPKAG